MILFEEKLDEGRGESQKTASFCRISSPPARGVKTAQEGEAGICESSNADAGRRKRTPAEGPKVSGEECTACRSANKIEEETRGLTRELLQIRVHQKNTGKKTYALKAHRTKNGPASGRVWSGIRPGNAVPVVRGRA